MPNNSYSLGGGRVQIDLARRVVTDTGQPVALGGRCFDLLTALLARRHQVSCNAELMQAVWPGLVVEDNNLQVHVGTLRKLLGQQAIVNVRGRGYQLVIEPDQPPAQALLGRDELLAEVQALLALPATRMLTLHGPGGVGKTLVAETAAQACTTRFDGCSIVALASLRDSHLVADAVLRAFGLQTAGELTPLQIVAPRLGAVVEQWSCKPEADAAPNNSALLYRVAGALFTPADTDSGKNSRSLMLY